MFQHVRVAGIVAACHAAATARSAVGHRPPADLERIIGRERTEAERSDEALAQFLWRVHRAD